MKRRAFLGNTSEAVLPVSGKKQSTHAVNRFANKVLPRVERTTAGIEPYTGPWGHDQVAHLLRRTMFGATKADIDAMLAHTLDDVVTLLLTSQPTPSPPLNTSTNDQTVPLGQTWVNAAKLNPDGTNPNSARTTSLKSWWVGLMLNQPISIVGKMTLFWHNHFVTETDVVGDARYYYQYNALLRGYALGNFKDLTIAITINAAMLRYLNGNTNTSTNPNENYARELQELFTIGKGPEIASGNYTNYTEDDVKAAAKVLTGWREHQTTTDNITYTISSYFTLSRHDQTNKQFSADYGNTVINGSNDATGNTEIDALLTMIFNQAETARFICRKLYRWFVYYVIDDTTEANVIQPLANILRTNNYEITLVLQMLLKSAHFFDPVNVGCIIKNPIDLTVGMCRQFNIQFPPQDGSATQLQKLYTHWKYVRQQAGIMQLDVGDPPNVAGWPSYYQIPQYYELWINSDTLPKRNLFTDTLIGNGYTASSFKLVVDPIALALEFSNPADPNVLIGEAAQVFFPFVITNNQMATLKETLIPGLPDYEWTSEWNDYINNPTDAAKKNSVKTKLQALFGFIMDMAEYQLM